MPAAGLQASGQTEQQEATLGVEQVDGVLSGQQARADSIKQAETPTHAFNMVLPFLADCFSRQLCISLHAFPLISTSDLFLRLCQTVSLLWWPGCYLLAQTSVYCYKPRFLLFGQKSGAVLACVKPASKKCSQSWYFRRVDLWRNSCFLQSAFKYHHADLQIK